MPSSNGNGHQLEITPVSAWLNDYDPVRLPSGKVVGLRSVDILSLILEDGSAPNFLTQFVEGHMSAVRMDKNGMPEMDGDDMKRFVVVINKIARACFANPPIVDDMEAVQRGEGILLSMISMEDKSALIPWGMGGQAAIDNASRFFEQQKSGSVTVLPVTGVSSESKSDAESKE